MFRIVDVTSKFLSLGHDTDPLYICNPSDRTLSIASVGEVIQGVPFTQSRDYRPHLLLFPARESDIPHDPFTHVPYDAISCPVAIKISYFVQGTNDRTGKRNLIVFKTTFHSQWEASRAENCRNVSEQHILELKTLRYYLSLHRLLFLRCYTYL